MDGIMHSWCIIATILNNLSALGWVIIYVLGNQSEEVDDELWKQRVIHLIHVGYLL